VAFKIGRRWDVIPSAWSSPPILASREDEWSAITPSMRRAVSSKTMGVRVGSHDLLRELFERAPVGVAIFDRELRFSYLNGALAAINGPSVEQHLGRTIEEVVPELAVQARELFERVLESGEPLVGWELTGETKAAPGETRCWLEDIYPLFEGDSVAALGAVIVEITDRRRAEDELREQRERAQRLLAQLESGLTPSTAPPRGWGVAWRYRAAESEMLLGGDFLGFVERPDGSLDFAIGDVAGRGPEAAGIGASLRSGWRALAETGAEPGIQMAALDGVVDGYGKAGIFATVCVGRFSATRTSLEIASAGHHAPLRLSPEGNVPLPIGIGPALGVPEAGARWPTNVVAIEAGMALLLFTDGIFEGRRSAGSSERLHYAGLATQVPDELFAAGDLDGCVDELLERVENANGGPLDDDVALLLIRPQPA
jgi:PAS domain S-box-containing protein